MSTLCKLFLVFGDIEGHISWLQSLLPVLCDVQFKVGIVESQKLSKLLYAYIKQKP